MSTREITRPAAIWRSRGVRHHRHGQSSEGPDGFVGPCRRNLPPPEGSLDLGSLEALIALVGRSRASDAGRSRTSIEQVSKERQQALAKQIEELEKAAKRSFWDKMGDAFAALGKALGAALGVALSIVTLGAGSPLGAVVVTACVVSLVGQLEEQLGLLEKLGLDPGVIAGIRLGVAGASLVAGGVAGAAQAGAVAGSAARGVSHAQKIGTAAAGGLRAVGGASQAVGEHHRAEALASAEAASVSAQGLQRWLDTMFELLEQQEEANGRAVEHVRHFAEARSASLSAAAQFV